MNSVSYPLAVDDGLARPVVRSREGFPIPRDKMPGEVVGDDEADKGV